MVGLYLSLSDFAHGFINESFCNVSLPFSLDVTKVESDEVFSSKLFTQSHSIGLVSSVSSSPTTAEFTESVHSVVVCNTDSGMLQTKEFGGVSNKFSGPECFRYFDLGSL